MEPKEEMHIELEVSVNPDLPLGTTITNVVTIDSNEAPPSSTSVDAVVAYKPLNITKKTMDMEGNEIGWVNPGDRFTYLISFDNKNNDAVVTEVFLSDTLPSEVTFGEANVNNKNFIGNYDLKSHTYTGTLKSLAPKDAEIQLELVVDVNDNIPLGVVITNSVTIDSNETQPSIANVNIVTGEPERSMTIIPSVLRRNGTSPHIMAVIQIPAYSDIDLSDQPELYFIPDKNSDKVFNEKTSDKVLIGTGTQYVSGTENNIIRILFDRAQLMRTISIPTTPYGYGAFKLRVESKTYFAEAIIHITRFAGD